MVIGFGVCDVTCSPSLGPLFRVVLGGGALQLCRIFRYAEASDSVPRLASSGRHISPQMLRVAMLDEYAAALLGPFHWNRCDH